MTSRLSRRALLGVGGTLALVGAARWGLKRAARPALATGPLSTEALALIHRAWEGLIPSRVLDAHVHVVGLGVGGTGCEVGAHMQSPLYLIEYTKFELYLEAAGITDEANADAQYMAKLTSLASSQPHGRFLLFAFDRAYSEEGEILVDETEFYTPNDYVLSLAKAAPEVFVPCASIHPYRSDAVSELERVVAAGAMAVKWLPNAMGIDPSNVRCDAFYEALARLQIPLISHAGEEKAVRAEERQRLGNPLLLRRALEHGVTVVVAHCASLGQNLDIDAPEPQPKVDNFDLFLRLMSESRWEGKLFGEVSALTLMNRLGRSLEVTLSDEKLQRRLIYGSDYPVPAINALMQTRALVSQGFLTESERTLLNEIDAVNPLLCDFVLKRTIRHHGARFSDDVFMIRSAVFPRLA